MDQSFATSIALRSIKRIDPGVEHISASATQVVLYEFNKSKKQWEKCDKEGALFVYSRSEDPFHSILIMNRVNITNVLEHVVKGFECWVEEPFLLYMNSKKEIFGLWFFDKEECARITAVLKSLIGENGSTK